MSDPERISKRDSGLAAYLLRAGAVELPSSSGVQRTLAALGASGVVLGTTTTASALGSGANASVGAGASGFGAGGAKVATAALLAKWVGIGVVGGLGLAGSAAVATQAVLNHTEKPSSSAPPRATSATRVAVQSSSSGVASASLPPLAPPAAPLATLTPARRVVAGSPVPAAAEPEESALLAEELALVDHARALLAAGRAEQSFALLQTYESRFPRARLLPEVLLLRLESSERTGREAEARAAARRLIGEFPNSPHTARARKLLFP